MAVTPNSLVTPQNVRRAAAVCTAAKTTYADATNAVKLADAGANGSLVKSVKALPRATVTATQLQLYASPDNGTTMHLIDSVLMAAYTMAQTTAVPVTDFALISNDAPLRLGAGDSLWVAIGVALAGGIVFRAGIEDY